MANRGHLSSDPHLQVGARLKAFLPAISLALLLVLNSSPVGAASESPTATAKATASPTAIASTTAKATTKATPKPTATKKTVTKKKSAKKKASLKPSPKPSWPPKGFRVQGEVYAKIPTAKELVSLISANSYLERQIKECTKYICGAVQVTAHNGCIWWQVVALVTDGQGKKLGELTKSFSGSTAKEFKTLLLISPETLENGGAAKVTSVICNHVVRDPAVPGSFYIKAVTPSAEPSATS